MSNTLKMLSGGAMRVLLIEAVPLFESASGIRVDLRFALTSVLKKEIESGVSFDVALLPHPELDALADNGDIADGTQTDIARSAVGLCVRSGAPKPDIGTVAAFKRALLAARTVAYSDGPSGVYVTELLERLGMAQEMNPKIRLTSGPVAELVARGEADIGLQQIVAILPVEGADLVGPLPGELQNIIVYAAGLSARSPNKQAARAFVTFMLTPQIVHLIRLKGMEPG